MLEELSGRTHAVVSGLALVTPGWEYVEDEAPLVTFRALTPRDLANYVAAALVFGQFVGQQPISWTTELLGITMWLALAAICYWLSGEE